METTETAGIMETAEITDTTSEITYSEPAPVYAGFWRRFVGWFIDILIIIIISHWVTVAVSSVVDTPIPDTISFRAIFSSLLPVAIIIFAINFIIIALYYCLLEASPLQATVGKYIAGLKITDMEGLRISYRKAFLRRIYSLLSTIPLFIGYIVAGFTSRKQTLHDMLAKTVVVVNKPRKTIVLVGIVILTLVVGVLSDKYLGAGFHFYFNAPGTHYDTQNGLQDYIVQKGNEVDPVLKESIIGAYLRQKNLFASGNLPEIRQYFLDSTPTSSKEEAAKELSTMSDSDFQEMVKPYNQVFSIATEEILRDPDAVWTFSKNMDWVRIQAKIPTPKNSAYPATKDDTKSVYVNKIYTNGQWY